jgi:hypothetical protein
MVSSGVKTHNEAFDLSPASLLKLKQPFVSKKVVVAMPKSQDARRRASAHNFKQTTADRAV